MNKEILLKKKQELEEQRQQAIANVNAICGALQLLEQMIAETEESDNA